MGEKKPSKYVPPDLPPQCTWNKKGAEDPHHHLEKKVKPKILANILEQIGNTPLVKLNRIPKEHGLKCEVLVKCEFFNAGGSVKDRIGLRMIEEAERDGKIKPGYTIIEPTSGNTGIGLALAAAVKGYRCIIVMPEKMSVEKANVLRALGAEIIRTPTAARFDDIDSHICVAYKLNEQIKNSIVLDQYRNPGNPLAHYDGTAEEIIDQCDERLDMVVISAGTGGTITGIGRKFKERLPNCQVVGVDPYGSILAEPEELNKSNVSFYEVEGIGYDFIPSVCDRTVVDRWIKSEDASSLRMARQLILKEGLLCGGSSGSAMTAAIEVAKELGEGQRCVVVLPDGVRNYMTKFIDDEWMYERNFFEKSKKPWYWDEAVSKLINGMAIQSVDENTECKDAIEMMRKFNYDQLPVVNETKQLLGIVTIDHILDQIANESATMDSKIKEVLIKSFPKVLRSEKLGNITKILKKNRFVVVCDKTSDQERIAGIITHIDVLNFLAKLDHFVKQ